MSKDNKWLSLLTSEDWWAVWLGMIIIVGATVGAAVGVTGKVPKVGEWLENPAAAFGSYSRSAPLETKPDDLVIKGLIAKKLSYDEEKGVLTYKGMMTAERRQHVESLSEDAAYMAAVDALCKAEPVSKGSNLLHLVYLLLFFGVITAVAMAAMGENALKYMLAFAVIFGLAVISYVVAGQVHIKSYGVGYAFWGLGIGLLISNTIRTPDWLMRGAKTEMFIKTGLVLLGAEILFGKILKLGGPGLFVAWMVTPTVIIFMYFFGTKLMKMTSNRLVIIIAAATSVCGVSAAIATAAACKAKKEELTLAVGMTLIFTVLMMIFMPMAIKASGMDPIVGAAWMGGTIDATGAVVAAGSMLGYEAEQVAAVVKMIQNILIGVVAFCVAVLWVTRVERDPNAPKPTPMEIWYRFPKFIVGFIAASLVFSFVLVPLWGGGDVGVNAVTSAIISPVTKTCRGWLFCLAFVSIGLESNFRDLAKQMVGGKPIVLYVVGQSFNLLLTILAAYLAFGGILFDKPI